MEFSVQFATIQLRSIACSCGALGMSIAQAALSPVSFFFIIQFFFLFILQQLENTKLNISGRIQQVFCSTLAVVLAGTVNERNEACSNPLFRGGFVRHKTCPSELKVLLCQIMCCAALCCVLSADKPPTHK